jgi:diguanylate cyclase (GGDEF)-like protein
LPGGSSRRSGACRGVPFGLRLFAALAVALAIVGVVAYALMSERLEQHQIDDYAGKQQADAAGAEAQFATTPGPEAIREIDDLLDAAGARPGTTEASLIGPTGTIVASSDESLVGQTDREKQIVAALEKGESRYGREVDPGEDSSDFEFITPVELQNGRYALERSVSSEGFDAQLAGVRETLLLIWVIALFGVGGLFYLLGGRALLRSHRIALQRTTVDGLTDLPNQRAFQADLEQAVAAADRRQEPLALVVLDIDHLKLINDRHGHREGDATLKRVADVLRQGRTADRAYRVGEDDFGLILPGTDVEGAEALTMRLSRKLARADVSASIGVSVMRGGGTAGQLHEEAGAASYEAKRLGGGRAVQFEQIREVATVTTAVKREATDRLIDLELVRTVFQPIWAFSPVRMIGLEALSRPDPSLGFAGPAEAFDVAEQIERAPELDLLCARTALHAFNNRPELDPTTPLFLNLAPRTLERQAGKVRWLEALAFDAGVEPSSVVVEVTERTGARTSKVVESLRGLRSSGFQLALDDVGTGNSGLEMLHNIHPDFVKLDRSIVVAAPTEPNARAVLMAMATYAAQTGAFVIAEGVEDEDTLAFLRRIEEFTESPGTIVHGAQGFVLNRPDELVPVEVPAPLAPPAEHPEHSWR